MKTLFVSLLAFLSTVGYAEQLVLNNRTEYPESPAKMAIQWANSAKEVDEGNAAIKHGSKLNAGSLHPLYHMGKVNVPIPRKAEYFRVVVWSRGEGKPDLITNWVEIIPSKTYTLQSDQLVPSVLMLGTGC
jgi:hypothetical protein